MVENWVLLISWGPQMVDLMVLLTNWDPKMAENWVPLIDWDHCLVVNSALLKCLGCCWVELMALQTKKEKEMVP